MNLDGAEFAEQVAKAAETVRKRRMLRLKTVGFLESEVEAPVDMASITVKMKQKPRSGFNVKEKAGIKRRWAKQATVGKKLYQCVWCGGGDGRTVALVVAANDIFWKPHLNWHSSKQSFPRH